MRITKEPKERFCPGLILEGARPLRLIEVPWTTIFEESTLTALSTGRFGPCLETLIIPTLEQTNLLVPMVKLRNHDAKTEQITQFRNVTLNCQSEEVEQHQAALEEIGTVSVQYESLCYSFAAFGIMNVFTITFQS